MRRRCHNQMQASWPSPRKGRHLLHLPKALFSKPQRTKWCEGESERGAEENLTRAEPHVSAGNASGDANADAERLGHAPHVLSTAQSSVPLLEIPAEGTEPAQADGWVLSETGSKGQRMPLKERLQSRAQRNPNKGNANVSPAASAQQSRALGLWMASLGKQTQGEVPRFPPEEAASCTTS